MMRSQKRAASTAGAPGTSSGELPPPLIKVALLGDTQVGKTSLMYRYVEGTFDDTQLQTQGVNFMEKTVNMQGQKAVFSIWDIGGHEDFNSMLPLVCNDAVALLLVFDLTRHETLESIREWHRKARQWNKCAIPFLIGAKYDQLVEGCGAEEHAHVAVAAQKFAAAIDAPLLFCATSVPINVSNIFKVILIRLFGLQSAVPQIVRLGQPLLIYQPDDIAAASRRASSSSSAGLIAAYPDGSTTVLEEESPGSPVVRALRVSHC